MCWVGRKRFLGRDEEAVAVPQTQAGFGKTMYTDATQGACSDGSGCSQATKVAGAEVGPKPGLGDLVRM